MSGWSLCCLHTIGNADCSSGEAACVTQSPQAHATDHIISSLRIGPDERILVAAGSVLTLLAPKLSSRDK